MKKTTHVNVFKKIWSYKPRKSLEILRVGLFFFWGGGSTGVLLGFWFSSYMYFGGSTGVLVHVVFWGVLLHGVLVHAVSWGVILGFWFTLFTVLSKTAVAAACCRFVNTIQKISQHTANVRIETLPDYTSPLLYPITNPLNPRRKIPWVYIRREPDIRVLKCT